MAIENIVPSRVFELKLPSDFVWSVQDNKCI